MGVREYFHTNSEKVFWININTEKKEHEGLEVQRKIYLRLTPNCGVPIKNGVYKVNWQTMQNELIDLLLVTKLPKQDFAHLYTYLKKVSAQTNNF